MQIFSGGRCFSWEQNFGAGKRERRRTDYKKVLSSRPPLHGIILEILWNASQDHLSWGRKGETLIHRLQALICQRFTWNKSPALLGCIGVSMEQVPVVSHSVVSTEKPQGRKQGVHLQKVGQNMRTTGCHGSGWNETQAKLGDLKWCMCGIRCRPQVLI